MNSKLTRRDFLKVGGGAVAGAALLPACGGGSQGSSDLRQVTFQMDTSLLPKHGIFYAAVGQGFYEEEGLDASIEPGTGSFDTSVAVGSGEFDFGFADFTTMVGTRQEGLEVQQLAAIHAQSPFAVVTLPRYNINSFQDLKGRQVAGEPAGSTTILFPVALELCGIDESDVEIINVDPRAKTPGLLSGEFEAILAYSVSDPAILVEEGAEPVILQWSECGFEGYSNGLIATDEMIQNDPDLVQRFVTATLRGVKWACENPDAAAANTQEFIQGLGDEAARAGIDLACDLVWTPEARENGLGWYDESKVADTIDLGREIFEIGEGLDLSETYTNEFNPEITPNTEVSPP